jgi:hypothetical protein
MLKNLQEKKKLLILKGEDVVISIGRNCGKTYVLHESIKVLCEQGLKTLLLSKNYFKLNKNNVCCINEEDFTKNISKLKFDAIFIDDYHLFNKEKLPKSYNCQIVFSEEPLFVKNVFKINQCKTMVGLIYLNTEFVCLN